MKDKKRHWFATGYFYFCIILHSWLFISYIKLLFSGTIKYPDWPIIIGTSTVLLLLVSYFALLAWKKWSIYTIGVSVITSLLFNAINGKGIDQNIPVIYGVIILALFLGVGNERKIWPQLD